MTAPTTVAVYCRISPQPDDPAAKVDRQERWGRDYAARAWPGAEVAVYRDENLSAANGGPRPGYERLRADVRDGRITSIWTVEQSRLERDELGWFTLAAELEAARITEIHTNRDGIVRVRDLSAGIKALVNAEERRRMLVRVSDTFDAHAEAGRPLGAPTFGYRRAWLDDGTPTLEIVPEQAAIVREAAERVLAGWSLSHIAQDLNRRGIRGHHAGRVVGANNPKTRGSRRAGQVIQGKIRVTGVRNWLRSDTIAGRVVRGGRVYGGNWEAILDEETWRTVKAKISAPRKVTDRFGREHTTHVAHRAARKYWITGGLARCGRCGAAMLGRMHSDGKPKLQCPAAHAAINLHPTQDYVADALFAELDRPEFVQAIIADEHADRRHQLTAELEKIERRRRTLAEDWADGQLDRDEWQAARARLDDRQADLRAELAALPARVDGLDTDSVRLMRAAWPTMTLAERREFVQLFVERVEVAPAGRRKNIPVADRVTITWKAG